MQTFFHRSNILSARRCVVCNLFKCVEKVLSKVFQAHSTVVSGNFQGCFKIGSNVLLRMFPGVSRRFQGIYGRFKGVSFVFLGSFMGVSRKLCDEICTCTFMTHICAYLIMDAPYTYRVYTYNFKVSLYLIPGTARLVLTSR